MSLNEKVSPGDPFRPAADDWNAMLDAANGYRQRNPVGPESDPGLYPSAVVMVKNDSGVRLTRFAAVGLGAPIILPAANLPEFKRQPTFKVVKPVAGTHEGKTGILLEPLAAGAIGACLVSGVAPCQITGADVGFAEITNGQTYLTAAATGKVQVLWPESGSGLRWAYVRLLGVAASTGGGGTALTAEESDGSPSVSNVDKIIIDRVTGVTIVDSINWTNCTHTTKTLKLKLTDNGSGDVTISLEAV